MKERFRLIREESFLLMISGGAVRGVRVVLNEQDEVIEERFELNSRD